MTKVEFAGVMAYLSAACAKPVTKEQAEVYWDLLGDLPLAALQASARRALLESQYPTLPPVGVLRRLAVEATHGSLPTTAEAWEMAQRALRLYPAGVWGDRGPFQRAVRALPAAIVATLRALGIRHLLDAENQVAAFAQFRDAYQAFADSEQRLRLLPANERAPLAVGRAEIKALTGGIGLMAGEIN